MARTAGPVCPGIEVEEDEIRGLMDHAQLTDHHIMAPDRFRPDDELVAHGFVQS